jgi:hypothetical protein
MKSSTEQMQEVLNALKVDDLALTVLGKEQPERILRDGMMLIAKHLKRQHGLSFDDFAKLTILNALGCLVAGEQIEERFRNN